MLKRAIMLAALGLPLGACGVWGAKGNDTGGIIPWSPEAERTALEVANAQCASSSWGRKSARITSMRRDYGEYIVYQCVFDGPLRRNGTG